jgi:DNA-binding transcriptional regulator LsrR (DeoR family)
VDVQDYEQGKGLPGVKGPFARRKEIDIVVTSLGDPHHRDGSLNRFLRLGPEKGLEHLREDGVVGEVQCMPYSPDGPVTMRSGFRAVTLFEIPELVAMAKQKRKHVLLVAAPCGRCGALKSEALRPLLKVPNLRIWTHVVMDIAHAERLAALDAPSEANRDG